WGEGERDKRKADCDHDHDYDHNHEREGRAWMAFLCPLTPPLSHKGRGRRRPLGSRLRHLPTVLPFQPSLRDEKLCRDGDFLSFTNYPTARATGRYEPTLPRFRRPAPSHARCEQDHFAIQPFAGLVGMDPGGVG